MRKAIIDVKQRLRKITLFRCFTIPHARRLLAVLPTLCLAGSASGADLYKYWVHFAIFFAVLVYLWQKKLKGFLISWANEVNETISRNTQLLNEALERKAAIESKLANIQSEIESMIYEAHQTGKARRESLLAQLRDEIKMRLRYKEQLEQELRRSLDEAFRSFVMARSKELVMKKLGNIDKSEQIDFFERNIAQS